MIAQQLDGFLDELQAAAEAEFHATAQYALLCEKLAQMECDCNSMFLEDEREFAQECFALIRAVDSVREAYVYRKAFRDCVDILQRMRVLT